MGAIISFGKCLERGQAQTGAPSMVRCFRRFSAIIQAEAVGTFGLPTLIQSRKQYVVQS
jgi:hypothetical protein